MRSLFSRRAVLGAALAAPFGVARAAEPRVVALDWGWAATAIGLDIVPAGVAEIRLYRDWVHAPSIPSSADEIGLRTDPSMDAIAALRPDLILTNAFHTAMAPRLATIAPTLANPTFSESRTPLANAKAAARLLGDRLSRRLQAAALINDAESRISLARDKLQSWSGRAVLPLSVIDRRHLMIHGEGGLFVDVLGAVGLKGLWPTATNLWGSKQIGVADLAGLPPGDLLLIDPVPEVASGIFDPSGLLLRLCAADRRAIRRMPAAWAFGDLTAAARFAELLPAALDGGPPA
jgi:ferric hydroxamate transport system substrate-binding protein